MRTFFKRMALCFSMGIMSITMSAQFSLSLTAEGTNAWVSIPSIPIYIIDNALGHGMISLGDDWLQVKDEDGRIDVDNGNGFGFKAKDLFHRIGAGVRLGWQADEYPFGVYVNGGYLFHQFRMQPDRMLNYKEKYKVSMWQAGIDVRVAPPIEGFGADEGLSPLIEAGIRYRSPFSCSAPYDDSLDQFGKGLVLRMSLGLCFLDWGGSSLALTFELPTYNYFEQNFTLENGMKPYSKIKSKHYYLCITGTIGL